MPSFTCLSFLGNVSCLIYRLSLIAKAWVFSWRTGASVLTWSGIMVKEVELFCKSMFDLTWAMLGPFLTASSLKFSLSPTHGRLVCWLTSATEIGAGGSL